MRHQLIAVLALLPLAAAFAKVKDWTEGIPVAPPARLDRVVVDGKLCFTVAVVDGEAGDAEKIRAALPRVCRALRDPELKSYLLRNRNLLKHEDRQTLERGGLTPEKLSETIDEILEPTKELLAPPSPAKPRAVDFYVIALEAKGPGLSEICVRHQSDLRAIRISRNARLVEPVDVALLVNTLAHESIHLHARSPGVCLDLFNDNGSNAKQCHSMSYVVGNAAACSYKRSDQKWTDDDWQDCMAKQARLTPGYQKGPDKRKDAFGCR